MQADEGLDDRVKAFIPECPEHLKPYVGRRFLSLEEGINCYRAYAAISGFDVRLSTIRTHTDGTVLHRYILCNREGSKDVCLSSQSSGKRSTTSSRVSCMARVLIKFNGLAGYVISLFNEAHAHPLVQDDYKIFMKSSRHLDASHKMFALNCFRAGLGVSKSYELFKELVGGLQNVGCSKQDFKNFVRDLRASVCGADAQVILDNLQSRRANNPGFVFDHEIDQNKKLIRLFWADQVSIQFYKSFGDVVSFDATYTTNKYNIIFAPFTGKDNHGRCVTFGAGLLNSEDSLSYTWLLDRFRNAVDNKKPAVIITDQDLAVKVAVEMVFPSPGTRHRFCMWHIMLKLADKIPTNLRGHDGFMQQFHDVVSSTNLSPVAFEEKWNNMMVGFGLVTHKWFTKIFSIRTFWIPAYFRDFPMGGLFRTTSMSESQNSFFQKYLNKNSNLVEFFMHFGSAIDTQRYEHHSLTNFDVSTVPDLLTSHPLEKHAASIYTQTIFKKVQREFVAALNECCIIEMSSEEGCDIYEIDYTAHGAVAVTYRDEDHSFTCGCNYFQRKGLLCRHIFFVMKNRRMNRIPEKYVLPRWSKFAAVDTTIGSASTISCEPTSLRNQLYAELYNCIGIVDGNPDLSLKLLSDLKDLMTKYSSANDGTATSTSNLSVFQEFYGGSIPDSVSILSPSSVKTKGSGSRLKSRMEKALNMASKPKRKCRVCKKLVNHDARNCDQRIIED